jgi:hypothetical protein
MSRCGKAGCQSSHGVRAVSQDAHCRTADEADATATGSSWVGPRQGCFRGRSFLDQGLDQGLDQAGTIRADQDASGQVLRGLPFFCYWNRAPGISLACWVPEACTQNAHNWRALLRSVVQSVWARCRPFRYPACAWRMLGNPLTGLSADRPDVPFRRWAKFCRP